MSTKSPTWVAANYNIGDDAASVTWGTENTSANVENGASFRLRVRVAETNAATTANTGSWVLQGIVNGGTPFTITGSTDVAYYNSANVTDGTTNFAGILTDIGGATYDETWNEQDENNSVTSRTWSDSECEYEYSLILNNVSVTDTVTFRMLSPSTSTAVTFDNVPTITVIAANTNRNPAQATGTFAGLAPTRTVTDLIFRNPTAGAGTFTGAAPGVIIPVFANPTAGTGTFSGAAPTADRQLGGGGPGLSLVFGLNLEATGNVIRSPAQATGVFAGAAPTVAQTWSASPGAGAGTFAGAAPTVSATANQWIDVGGGNPNEFAGLAPTLAQTANQWITPDAGAIAASGKTPALAQTANHWITPDAGAGTFAGKVPVAESGGNVTKQPSEGTGVFSGLAPTLAQTANQFITPDAGSLTGAGSAPVSVPTLHQWVTPDSGSGAFSGDVPTVVNPQDVVATPGTGSGTFTGYAPTLVTPTTQEEAPTGGWYFRYEQEMLRREEERKKLEQAVEAEISALIEGTEAVPAETAAPEYLQDLREIIAEAEREEEFRRFIESLALRQAEDELARLLKIEAAILKLIRQRKDEEEFIQLLMLAA